jgi:hypothetical protein
LNRFEIQQFLNHLLDIGQRQRRDVVQRFTHDAQWLTTGGKDAQIRTVF